MCIFCGDFAETLTSPSSSRVRRALKPKQGSDGLGDSLYPGFGNGGYDVKHYTLDLNVKNVAKSKLDGRTTIKATAAQDLSRFNLDFIGLEIQNIEVNGQKADFSRRGQELSITPSKSLKKDEQFNVVVDYSGSPSNFSSVGSFIPMGWLTFPGGSYVLGQPDGAATYSPVNDHPLDRASYTFKITVPTEYEVAANGLLEKTTEKRDSTTFLFEARDPMASYLATINIVPDFRVTQERGPNGILVRNFFDTRINPKLLKPFDLQGKMIEFFNDIFGPYPFEAYGSVVVDTYTSAALETQTLSIFGRDFLRSPLLEPVIAHELAHQWFGDAMAVGNWSAIWLNESFATYAEGLWIEESQGKRAFGNWVKDTYSDVDFRFNWLIPPGEPSADDIFNDGVYIWGAVGLHALRLKVGDDTFFDILQTYYDRYNGQNVLPADFLAVVEEVADRKFGAFFDRWFYSDALAPIRELDLIPSTYYSGSSKADEITGKRLSETFKGGGGNDVLNGKSGNDKLYGGKGRNRLTGEKGDDFFYLHPEGFMTITDFEDGGDRLGLNKLRFQDLGIRRDGKNTLIESGDQMLARLEGVRADSVTRRDFIYSGSSISGIQPEASGAA